VFLAAPNAFANSPEATNFAALAEVLKTGDLIAVTPWSGKKLKGQLVEVTDCSIRLRTAGTALSIESAAIKTVRRYPPKARAAKSAWGAVERCDRVECAPTTLAVVGVAALVKSLRDAGGAEIVYRGSRAQSAARAARSATVRARSPQKPLQCSVKPEGLGAHRPLSKQTERSQLE
jgi:hypothetical protein